MLLNLPCIFTLLSATLTLVSQSKISRVINLTLEMPPHILHYFSNPGVKDGLRNSIFYFSSAMEKRQSSSGHLLSFFVFWLPKNTCCKIECICYWPRRSEVRFPTVQIEHSVTNGSPPLRRFLGSVLPRG